MQSCFEFLICLFNMFISLFYSYFCVKKSRPGRNVNFSLCLVCCTYGTVPVEMLPSPSVQFAVRTVQYRQKCYLLLLSSLQYVRYSTGRNVTFSFCPVCSTYGTAELGPSIVLTKKLLHIPVIKDTKFIYCLFKLMQAVIKLWRKIQPPPSFTPVKG